MRALPENGNESPRNDTRMNQKTKTNFVSGAREQSERSTWLVAELRTKAFAVISGSSGGDSCRGLSRR